MSEDWFTYINKRSFKNRVYLKNLKLFVYPLDSGPFAGIFLKSPLNQRFFKRALIHCIRNFIVSKIKIFCKNLIWRDISKCSCDQHK